MIVIKVVIIAYRNCKATKMEKIRMNIIWAEWNCIQNSFWWHITGHNSSLRTRMFGHKPLQILSASWQFHVAEKSGMQVRSQCFPAPLSKWFSSATTAHNSLKAVLHTSESNPISACCWKLLYYVARCNHCLRTIYSQYDRIYLHNAKRVCLYQLMYLLIFSAHNMRVRR